MCNLYVVHVHYIMHDAINHAINHETSTTLKLILISRQSVGPAMGVVRFTCIILFDNIVFAECMMASGKESNPLWCWETYFEELLLL